LISAVVPIAIKAIYTLLLSCCQRILLSERYQHRITLASDMDLFLPVFGSQLGKERDDLPDSLFQCLKAECCIRMPDHEDQLCANSRH
jgi:hypothetical protein